MESVNFLSPTLLPCSGTSQAPVILCLVDTVELVSGYHTVPAVLTVVQDEFDGVCGDGLQYRYTFAYDETLLTDPTALLATPDITNVFCDDCFLAYIRELIAGA